MLSILSFIYFQPKFLKNILSACFAGILYQILKRDRGSGHVT